MPIVFTGEGLCATGLSSTRVTTNTGATTISITPATTGAYIGCQLAMRDHAGNYSNRLNMSTFIYGTTNNAICLHPDFTVPINECMAMVDFYNATNGNGRTNSTGRLVNLDADSRYGVVLYVTGSNVHVKDISLNNNNLSGSLPNLIGRLSYMQNFSVRKNNLQGTLPADFWGMTGLTYLDLDQNHLQGNIASSISNLTNLQTLYLSNNLFSGTLTTGFDVLSELKTISLANNSFNGNFFDRVANASLTTINIASNNFAGQLPSSIGQDHP